MHSLKDTIETLESLIPVELIPRSQLEEIKSIASWIPALLTYRLGFETYLQPPAERTDFTILAASFERGRDILAGMVSEVDFAPEILQTEEWQRIRQFCELWANPSCPIYNSGSVCLEFDVTPDQVNAPIPGFLFAVDDVPEKMDWLCSTALPLLLNREVSGNQKQNLSKYFQLFQSSTAFLGSMMSRSNDVIRLTILDIPQDLPQAMLPDWTDWNREVQPIYRLLSDLSEVWNINFDFGSSEVLPGIAIEFMFHRQSVTNPRWESLLNILVQEGLCMPEMKDQLLAWRGHTIQQFRHLLWRSRVEKRVNHIKIKWIPNQPLQSKVYYLLNYAYPVTP